MSIKNFMEESIMEVGGGEFAALAEQAPDTQTKTGEENELTEEDFEKANWKEYKKNTFWYIVFVLKAFSDKDHTMNPRGIMDRIDELFQGESEQTRESRNKTFHKNYMEPYFQLAELSEEEWEMGLEIAYTVSSYNVLTTIMGGTIKRKIEKTIVDVKGHQRKFYSYYFDNLFDDSDVIILVASLITNRSLFPDERDYMIEGLERLHALEKGLLRKVKANDPSEIKIEDVEDYISELRCLKERVEETYKRISNVNRSGVTNSRDEADITNPLFNRNYLGHIRQLYEAIQAGNCIKLSYGEFKRTEDNRRGMLTFDYKRNSDQKKSERVINPYALLSCNGHMYLVATNKGETIPRHFRVDRIMKLEDENDRKGYPVVREKVPELLKKYFDENGTFNELNYLRDHPMMGYYSESSKAVNYKLLTDKNGLAILYDHFGADLRVYEIGKKAKEFFHVDVDGEYYHVFIDGVFDDNMQLFLSHHHDMYTVVEPVEERDRMIKRLRDSLDRLNAMPSDEEMQEFNKNK